MRGHLVLLLLSQLASANAHPSCCTKHLAFIPDPEDLPPDQHEGQPRLIPDPADKRPPEWDDEDDGEWQPRDKPNPAFTWRARLIPNPKYSPPGFLEALLKEVLKAAPWVVLGLAVTVALEVAQLPLDGLGALLRSAGPLTGALAGLATPLCSCGMLPVAAGLVAKVRVRVRVRVPNPNPDPNPNPNPNPNPIPNPSPDRRAEAGAAREAARLAREVELVPGRA